jgi:hypothetical protein
VPWRDIFTVVCFIAAAALAVGVYVWRDEEARWFAAALLGTGALFTGVALLMDDWVIPVALAAGALTAFAVLAGGYWTADRVARGERGVGIGQVREDLSRLEEEHAKLQALMSQFDYEQEEARVREREQHRAEWEARAGERWEARMAAVTAGLRSESAVDRLAAVSELVGLLHAGYDAGIRELLAAHVRTGARDGEDQVAPDVEAALVALVRETYGEPAPLNLARAHLRGLVLTDADLRGTVLSRADLQGALLEDVNLANARLTDANLRRVRFQRVDLSGASLCGADLRDAMLEHSTLDGATDDHTTRWPDGFPSTQS